MIGLKAHYRRGGLGDMVLCCALNDRLQAVLGPIRTRRAKFAEQPDFVMEMVRAGTASAPPRYNQGNARPSQGSALGAVQFLAAWVMLSCRVSVNEPQIQKITYWRSAAEWALSLLRGFLHRLYLAKSRESAIRRGVGNFTAGLARSSHVLSAICASGGEA